MSIKHEYGQYIPLREAFAQIGPSIVFGWRGDELDPGIWQEAPLRRRESKRDIDRFAAKEKYRRLGLWFLSAVQAGEIELFCPEEPPKNQAVEERPRRRARQQRSVRGMRKIDPENILAWWAPTAFSGRLTTVSVEEQLAGTVFNENDPVVYVDPGVVAGAAQRSLMPDSTVEYWSLSQAAYWVATYRHELVRDYKALMGSDYETAIKADLLMPMSEAHAAVWGSVVQGALEVSAVAEGSVKEEVLSSSDLRRITLEARYVNGDTHDLLITPMEGKVAFYDPMILRAEVMKRWSPPASQSPSDDRASVLRQLESGALSIDEAEEKAGRDLVQEPSKKGFDPKAERYWSIPMVLAGMTSDRADDVIEQMNEYRKRVRFYVDETGERLSTERLSKIRSERGHRVRVLRLEPASFWGLMHSDKQEAIADAWAILHDRLTSETVVAIGINEAKKQREEIAGFKWPGLVAHGGDEWDETKAEHYTEPDKDLECYSDVQIERSAVAALRNAFQRLPATPRLTADEGKACEAVARPSFVERVRNWPRNRPFPTADEDFDFMRAAVTRAQILPKGKAMPRKMLREIRSEILSAHGYGRDDWMKQGQRKPKTAK